MKHQPETARKLCKLNKRYYLACGDDMSTFLFFAFSSGFLLGMTADAFTRRIID